jgi:hypothetical protein
VRDFPVVPEKGGNFLPYKGKVQHTIVGKGMFPEEFNHCRVSVVSKTSLFETPKYFFCRRPTRTSFGVSKLVSQSKSQNLTNFMGFDTIVAYETYR